MKWQCSFGFMVPSGLLWVFPELSLARCAHLYTMDMDEEIKICECNQFGGAEIIV
jgi:hypothetical protein